MRSGAQKERYRLVYVDDAGFSTSAPIQYGWIPWGEPHKVEPQIYCRRSVLWALNHTDNTLFYKLKKCVIHRIAVVNFLDEVAKQGDDHLTILVLDNARIHHGIEIVTKERWLREHNMLLFVGFNVAFWCTDNFSAYGMLPNEKHITGKLYTQRIEREYYLQ